MQPLKLTMKNIGPFVGIHTIDFTTLDKIFLISGKTGSGKTTVLDALTYALYGALPGVRKTNDKRYLRSDFCSSQEECSICLDFLLNGCSYRVERALPFMYITRNSTEREEGETAALYRYAESLQEDLFANETHPSQYKLLTSQKSETDALLKSLLSLSLDEFSRIVLLPQGEFAVFLRQNSNERKAMLSKLFPVEQFSRITEQLKDHKSRRGASLEEVMTRLDYLRQTYNPDKADEQKVQYSKMRDDAKKEAEKNQKKMYDIRTELQKLEDQASQFNEFQIIETQLNEVLLQKEQISLDTERFELSNDATKIIPFINAYKKLQVELQKTEDDLRNCATQLLQYQEEQTELTLQLAEQKSSKQRISDIGLLLHDLERALDSEQHLKDSKTQLVALQTELSAYCSDIEKITKDIIPLDDFIRDAGDVQNDYDAALAQKQISSLNVLFAQDAVLEQKEIAQAEIFNNAKLILDDFITADKKAKIANQAATLALELHAGEACPVCGSTEHPQPATASESMLTTEEKIKTHEQLVKQAEKMLLETRGNRRELAGSISKSTENVPACDQQLSTFSNLDEAMQNEAHLKQTFEMAHKAVIEKEQLLASVHKAKEQKETLETELIPLRLKETSFAPDIATANTHVEQAQSELDSILQRVAIHTEQSGAKTKNSKNNEQVIDIKQTISALGLEQKELIQKTETFEKCQKQNEEQLLRLGERSELLEKALAHCNEQSEKNDSELTAALASSPFVAIKEPSLTEQIDNQNEQALQIKRVEQSILDTSAQKVIQVKIEHYKTEKLRLETLHKEKKSTLHGDAEQIAQKTVTLREEEEELQQAIRETNDALNDVQQQILSLETQTKEYSELESRRKEISVELAHYTTLYNAVSGNNPKKIPLDSWILGMYLEEITNFASKRLERISDSRYTMYLKSEAEGGRGYKGLDLEIYDAHTGKRRPCSTLSGGETFMASISLALAISDTVQSQNGGIQLESLFIDEGFGSLDVDALEKALGILDEIRETRSIGLISHVDSLKNRIPSQIKITKALTGSTIEICD